MEGPSTASAVARMPARSPLYAQVSGRATRRAPSSAAASSSSSAARTLAATSWRVFSWTQATRRTGAHRSALAAEAVAHAHVPPAQAMSESSSKATVAATMAVR